MAGIQLTHIPYKGSSPALTDLLGGHVAIYFSSLPPAIALMREGKVRALAVTGPKRSPLLPGSADGGGSGAAGLRGGAALRHRGAGRHAARRSSHKLSAALTAALAEPRCASASADGAECCPMTPEEYAADIDREETKWSKIVKCRARRWSKLRRHPEAAAQRPSKDGFTRRRPSRLARARTSG